MTKRERKGCGDVRDEKAHYVRGYLDIGPVADLIELVHSNIDT